MLVIELKSEALKDRHWKQLMKRLHVNWVVSELTLGQIWDVDLQKNEAIVKDVLLVAQGEMALEEFLKQVSSRSGGHPVSGSCASCVLSSVVFPVPMQLLAAHLLIACPCLLSTRYEKCGILTSSTWSTIRTSAA